MQGTCILQLPGDYPTHRDVLTTEHAVCSYGHAVLLVKGAPVGPGDLPPGAVLRAIDVDTEPGLVAPFNFRTALDPGDPFFESLRRGNRRRAALVQAVRAAGYAVDDAEA